MCKGDGYRLSPDILCFIIMTVGATTFEPGAIDHLEMKLYSKNRVQYIYKEEKYEYFCVMKFIVMRTYLEKFKLN